MVEKKSYELKLAFFTPYFEQNRGNSTTAKRIVTGLRKKGFEVEVFAYEEEEWTKDHEKRISGCSLFHILHFKRFALWQKKNSASFIKKYVLTSGGTDVNHDIFQTNLAKDMIDLIKNACAITVFSEDGKNKLEAVFTLEQGKVHVVPQSIWFPKSLKQEKTKLFSENAWPKILLPAGLRKVKDVLYLLPELEQLKTVFPNLEFVIVGAVLEDSTYREVLETSQKYSWLTYQEAIPLAEMKDVYHSADIVLNTSISEGQPAAILEAMSLGKLVFARRNGGNESVIEHQKNGFLFKDGDEFLEEVKTVLQSIQLQQQVCCEAKQYIENKHQLDQEIEHYIKIYNIV